MKRPTEVLLFLVGATVAVASCGRTDLDLGDTSTLPVTTGNAGTAGSAGTVGSAGTTGSAGTAGSAGTGAAGATGLAGAGLAGTAGAIGAAGSLGAPTGEAGATSEPTGSAGAFGGGGTLACGGSQCAVGSQTCCVQLRGAQPSAMCLPAGDTCDSGTSFGCANTPSCGAGSVCCVSTQSLSTSCESPAACLLSPGLILCGGDADCPNLLPNCCGRGLLKVCALRACGGAGGPGGPGGPGGR